MKNTLKTLAVLITACVSMYAAGSIGLARVEEASALSCARASSGTDQDIAACYTSRDLPVPADL